MSKSRFNYEFLPRKIADVVKKLTDSDREYRTKNNYLIVIGLVYFHQMSDETSNYDYSPLSREYWRTVVGSNYPKYVDRLVNEHVIQREWVQYVSDFGDESRVMGYRINPLFLTDDFALVKYAGAKTQSQSAEVIDAKATGNIPVTKLGIKPDLIRMQKGQALAWIASNISKVVNGYINNDYLNGVPKTLPVLVRIYHGDSFSVSHMSVESAQKIAKEHGKELLYYKDKFIIANAEQFNQIANHNLSVHYKWQVKSFLPENFNFSRNKNTLRVYSKLSSLPSALLPFIRINGQYILQADLKCSQFTLFANLINYYLNHSGEELVALFKKKQAKNFVSGLVTIFDRHKDELPEEGLKTTSPSENEFITNDVYGFLVDTLLHDFYGILKVQLGLPLRQHGKSIAFRTVFSKPKPENELVRQFRQIYPTVISIINDFKDKYGYNQFAIGLQRVEAVIFIDHIWQKAKQSGINCFTRHDSLVFPINKKQEVDKIIAEVFKSFDFIYRIEFEEFNTDEIMQRLINETDYVDYVDDFDEMFFYPIQPADNRDLESEENIRLQEQLQDIELPEHKHRDYYEHVNEDTLWMLLELDGLSLEAKLALEEDIANLQSNYAIPQFQVGTNKLISKLIDDVND
jgi:hypothetical protein